MSLKSNYREINDLVVQARKLADKTSKKSQFEKLLKEGTQVNERISKETKKTLKQENNKETLLLQLGAAFQKQVISAVNAEIPILKKKTSELTGVQEVKI